MISVSLFTMDLLNFICVRCNVVVVGKFIEVRYFTYLLTQSFRLQRRPQKILKIDKKTPMSESLFQ